MRGFFEIGIYHPKTAENIGTLWRSAYQLGAAGIFVIGNRCKKQASDTTQAWRHIPLRYYPTWDEFQESRPIETPLIAIEMSEGAPMLQEFQHPERAVYLLGAEDHGLPQNVLSKCQKVIQLSSIRSASYNVAVAGTLVMYDRQFKNK